ncbi:MAG: hypothetical protein P1U39_07870 [Legionellaceae bacterium]|nr:hypothetical protein [Legionellaceae bacterium]
MFFSRSLSLQEERARIVHEYHHAHEQLTAYQRQMAELFHPPIDNFLREMDVLHQEACVPTVALIKAIKQTEGFLKGEVTPEAYGRLIHDMKLKAGDSHQPSRLSQAMVTLSWAVWVLSIACVLAGPLLLGVVGLFASYAIYRDAEHPDVKYPNMRRYEASPRIVEQLETMREMLECGVAI